LKFKYKRLDARTPNVCDIVRCKNQSVIILAYIRVYKDSNIELCDECYFKLVKESHSGGTQFPYQEAEYKVVVEGEVIEDPPKESSLYSSIADYTTKTGKRFRLTKEEKSSGISREEAFAARVWK
jgi:hypothetical protein